MTLGTTFCVQDHGEGAEAHINNVQPGVYMFSSMDP